MPKKTATARSAAQRNRPRVQKSIELVRQPKETPAESSSETTAVSVSTSTAAAASPVSTVETPTAKATPASKETPRSKGERSEVVTSTASKGSASERLAARRQAVQKQRTAVNLISAEHYSYVRRDLIFIAILAAIMFTVIIILHFVPAIGG